MKHYAVRDGLGIFTMRQMVKNIAMMYRDEVCMQIKRGEKYQKITYHQLNKQVESLGAALIDLGMEPGDKVAILGENRPAWGVGYLSVASSGNIIVPLDSRLKTDKWRHILDDSECKYIITTDQYVDEIVLLKPDVESLKEVICMDKREELKDALYMGDLIKKGWQLIKSGKSKYNDREVELDDVVAILYTSGTTGTSKGVMLTHRNIMSNVNSGYRMLEYGKGDTFLSVLPLHHTFEATAGFLVPLFGGAAITYAKSLKSRDILEGIKETNVTLMCGVPLLYEKILQGLKKKIRTKPVRTRFMFKTSVGIVRTAKKIIGKNFGSTVFKGLRKKAGLDSIRLLISGGAALSEETERGFNELGLKLIQGYGLTESAPILTLNPPHRQKFGSIGPPLPDVTVKIDDPNKEGIGEVIAKGPNIMKGYYKNPEATEETIKNGWLCTGDLGRMDDEGYVYITGRSKNLIVSKAGKNIYPEEIEAELLKSEYIKEVLVIGVTDPKTERESVHAIVYPDYENIDFYAKKHDISRMTKDKIYQLIKDEISKRCDKLASYKRVKDFEIREEEFEKTTTRKIKRYLFKRERISVNNSDNK